MYQVIARKYRPDNFAELISQEHVRATLENAITQRRIAHGYILSGQRGTGKTTVARIIARCLNCVNGPVAHPCGVCASCTEIKSGSSVDVIEIDAASNRGINEMRELRENVRYRPARDRYKVFIIDEAHQITNEAFNALLKTLEEPPEWVVFILCTTESHKIPVTIASRCQQFSFRSVDFRELVARIRWICEQEGIEADDEVLAVLAQAGEGSVRDSLSTLDQAIACCGTTLSASEVRGLLGRFSIESLHGVTHALAASDPTAMLEQVHELERNGQNLQHFCRELTKYFRNLLVLKVTGQQTILVSASAAEQERMLSIAAGFSEADLTRYLKLMLDLFKDMQASLHPRLHLEVGLLRLIHAAKLVPIEQALSELRGNPSVQPPKSEAGTREAPAVETSPAARRPSPFAMDSVRKAGGSSAAAPAPAPVTREQASGPAEGTDWKQKIHSALLDLGMTFTADAVEHSSVTENNGELVFTTPKEFSLSMQEADIKKAVQQVSGRPMRVKIAFGEPDPAVAPAKEEPANQGEVSQRALSHPDVQRFQELFPDAQVRAVRNLKE
ncbi:MAG: DNA polymerase III subunit gamma/tau [Bryobacteraceae bacterium]